MTPPPPPPPQFIRIGAPLWLCILVLVMGWLGIALMVIGVFL